MSERASALPATAHAPGAGAGSSPAQWPAYDPQGRRIPDFFLIGQPKCGTTALHRMLSRHPQVFMPELKEPHFFLGDWERVEARHSSGRLPADLRQYLELFAGARADQLAGEASTSYLRSPVAAASIAALQPEARVVAILREPAALVRSLHLQLAKEGVERRRDLRRALEAERIVRDGHAIERYSGVLRYVEQLERYRRAFGRERMLVLIYDDLRRDNRAALAEVLRFLQLPAQHAIEPVVANPSVEVRSPLLDGAIRALYAGRGPIAGPLRGAARALVPERARHGLLRQVRNRLAYAPPGEPDQILARQLKLRYRGEVEALADYLGRDLLSLWGYERSA